MQHASLQFAAYSHILYLQRAIQAVLSREDAKHKYVLIATMKGCKEMLLTFRTEERRKVSEIAASWTPLNEYGLKQTDTGHVYLDYQALIYQ